MNELVAFISGHRDLTPQEFVEHYHPLILQAIDDGYHVFVVGDYDGADCMAQEFLARLPIQLDVTVFHMGTTPMYNMGAFPTNGGYPDDETRDAAMTMASSRDIAWIRPGKETSGTAQNLARRRDPNARIYRP